MRKGKRLLDSDMRGSDDVGEPSSKHPRDGPREEEAAGMVGSKVSRTLSFVRFISVSHILFIF